jgi:predicted O-methyltransferase YrrM
MSTSDILQVDHSDTPPVGVPWTARLRAHCREFLLHSWTLRQMHKAIYSHEGALQLAAFVDGAEYAAEHMRGAHASTDKNEVFLRGLDQAPQDGLFLEFGVGCGRTINLAAGHVNVTVHGFDRFEDQRKEWQPGVPPKRRRPSVRPNVTLHVGRFQDTLPGFAAANDASIAFLHANFRHYTSTEIIFQHLGDRLRPGTVIVFDRYFNFPGWRNHAYRSFQELVQERSLSYRYLAYNTVGTNVAAQITRS